MPTYDYQCEACQHTFEQFQSITAKPLRKCPECGRLKLKRLIGTGAGVLFKGAGFYETDYRSDSYKKAAKAEADGGKPGGDKASTQDKGQTKKGDAGTAADTAATKPKANKAKD